MLTKNTTDGYIHFFTGFAFKRLFGTEKNKDLLISFLNAVLEGRETVAKVTFIKPSDEDNGAYCIRPTIELYAENEHGEHFIVEVQKPEWVLFKERSLYYSSFALREQAPNGNWDYELKAIYVIDILGFSFDKTNSDYFHEVKLVDLKTKDVFFDKLTFIYLEMPKFTKTEAELQTLFDKWLYAIRNLASLMERPRALQEQVFTRLFQEAEIAAFAPQERREYEDNLKVYRDWYSVIKTAELRGMEKGEQKGLEKGIEIGKQEAIISVARQMKANGIAPAVIAQTTNLTVEEIEKL